MHKAQLGDRVRIQYSRLRKQGAATAKPRSPKVLEFTAGSSDIVPSVSFGVVGMAPGDQRRFSLQPEETNGRVPVGLARQKQLPRSLKRLKLHTGKRQTALPSNSSRLPRGEDIGDETAFVLAGGNHPLDGEVIELEVMLLSLDASSNANEHRPQFDLGGEG